VQTRATQLVLFDKGDGLSQLLGSNRGGVASATSAKDYEVEIVIGHSESSFEVETGSHGEIEA
jgi:hypothetical protein